MAKGEVTLLLIFNCDSLLSMRAAPCMPAPHYSATHVHSEISAQHVLTGRVHGDWLPCLNLFRSGG